MSIHNIDTHQMPTLTLCTKKDVLFYSISKYYDKHPDYIEEIISPIVDGSHQLSLRFIEKFITKYCKEKKIIIQDCNGKYVDIYHRIHPSHPSIASISSIYLSGKCAEE